jgi:hypothetical protein
MLQIECGHQAYLDGTESLRTTTKRWSILLKLEMKYGVVFGIFEIGLATNIFLWTF